MPRLRACRKELGLTQAQFAAWAGVGLGAQSRYEQGAIEPSASYFANLATVGVDVMYLLTGQRSADPLDAVSTEILNAGRRLDDNQRSALLAFLSTL